jgi:TPR repeat protein
MKKYLISLLFLYSTGAVAADAMSAFARKDYNEAYRIWYANPDTAEAQYGMGRIVLEGLGAAPKNPEKGLNLITKSASKGYRPALQYMAELTERSGNLQQALKFYESLSNKQDILLEQKILSIMVRIYKPDPTNSKKYCEQLVRVQNLGATSKDIDMALCSWRGYDSSKTKEEAASIISQSASDANESKDYRNALTYWEVLSDESSLFNRGKILFEGLTGDKKRLKEGFNLIEKSASSDNKVALQYLAQHYKKVGDKEKTKFYLNKLGDYRGAVEVDFIDKVISGIKLDKDFCENLSKAKYPTNSPEYEKVLECSFDGTLKDIDPIDSGKKLTKILASKPTIEIFMKLLPQLLNLDSDLYNPAAFEKALWTLDKNLNILQKIKDSGINFEKVRKLTASNEEQKNNKLAMMLAAALNKDKEAAYYLLESEPAKNVYWRSENLHKLNSLMSIVDSDAESIRYKKIKLRLLMAEGKTREHIRLIKEIMPSLEKDYLREHLSFLTRSVAANDDAKGSKVLNTTDVVEISELISRAADPQIVPENAHSVIEKFHQENLRFDPGNPDLARIESNLTKIKKMLDERRNTVNPKPEEKSKTLNNLSNEPVKTINQAGPVKSSQDNSASDKNTKSTSQAEASKSKESDISTSKSEKDIRTNEYGRFRYECDLKNGTSCFFAAEAIASKEPPIEFKNMTVSSRRELAMTFYEKSAELNNADALIKLYDIYSKESSKDSRDKAERYLKKLIELKNVSGEIRQLYNDLRFDLLKSPVQHLTKREYLNEKCQNAARLSQNMEISDSDRKIVLSVANGANCRLLNETSK